MEQLKLSNNVAKLHSLFGKKLYSDKFSFLSEICQNAVDSHRMAKVNSPVIFGVKQKGSGVFTLYIKDIGLSFKDPQDFVNKVCTILESGKSSDKTNDEDCPMGMHGVGSISVSAFSSSWNYRVVTPEGNLFTAELMEVEGKGLNYNIKEHGSVKESKSVLFEVDFNIYELNPLLVAIPRKLRFFRDIFYEFDIPTTKLISASIIQNLSNYKIIETDDLIISTMNDSSNYNQDMRICLDQYSYPIMWDKLGISPINGTSIALKFQMNEGLEADLTRENIVYNENYSKIVKAKLAKVAEYVVESYNKLFPDEGTSDVISAAKSFKERARLVQLGPVCQDINSFIQYSKVKPNSILIKDITEQSVFRKFVDNPNLFLFTKMYIQNNSKVSYYFKFDPVNNSDNNVILLDQKPSPKMLRYLKSVYKNYYLIEKGSTSLKVLKNNFEFKRVKSIYKSTGINHYRVILNDSKKIVDSVLSSIKYTKLSTITIPETFEPKKSFTKSTFNVKNIEGKIPVKRFINNTFSPFYIEGSDIQKGMKVYYTQHNDLKFKMLNVLVRSELNSEVCICSSLQFNRFEKIKQNYPNVMNIETLEIKDYPNIAKYASFFQNKEKYEHIITVTSRIGKNILELVPEFKKDLDQLNADTGRSGFKSTYNSVIAPEIAKVAKSLKIYDQGLHDSIDKIYSFCGLLSFVHKYDNTMLSLKDLILSQKQHYDIDPIRLHLEKIK
jgi:hypothetical protein